MQLAIHVGLFLIYYKRKLTPCQTPTETPKGGGRQALQLKGSAWVDFPARSSLVLDAPPWAKSSGDP